MVAGLERRARVVLTDHPWPDLDIETEIFASAGIELIAGPIESPTAATVERMAVDADPDAIMTCWATVSAAAIERPKRLRMVARLGIGLDNIAVESATRRGAWVTNVPSYCVGEVSDHALALMLAHYRGIVEFDRSTKAGAWEPERAQLERIADLCVGVIGFGQIGRATARKLAAFECRVLAHSRSLSNIVAPAEPASLERIQSEADVIILHAPLTALTRHIIGDAFLRGCMRQPLLINVSRGGLVDNAALLEALDSGRLRGAALDVIEGEPHPPLALLQHPRTIVTPHISFSSSAALRDLRRQACEDVVRVLTGGQPMHPCNVPEAPGVPLEGGVASDIRIVNGPNGAEVVKRALPKLRVNADWFANPARSLIEVAALQTAAELLGPKAVPKVLWSDPSRHLFAMNLIGQEFYNWKVAMLQGRVESMVARRAGEQLGRLHYLSGRHPDISERFADASNFEELRVEPFFVRTAAKCPELAPAILAAADGMRGHREALVHGDYSPKNILTDGHDIVILDWEVAHWGDPRFDIAFCMSHLILKGHRRGAERVRLLAAVAAFAAGYRQENAAAYDNGVGPLIGALLMARLRGPSPIDYLNSIDIGAVEDEAGRLLSFETVPSLADAGLA